MEWEVGACIIVHTVLELIAVDSLILAVVYEGSICINLPPLAWLLQLGVVVGLAACELHWLIVFWQHFLRFRQALVGPQTGSHIAWGRTFSRFHQILDNSSVLERGSSLEEENLEVVWDL
jgi:hypothetical protein